MSASRCGFSYEGQGDVDRFLMLATMDYEAMERRLLVRFALDWLMPPLKLPLLPPLKLKLPGGGFDAV